MDNRGKLKSSHAPVATADGKMSDLTAIIANLDRIIGESNRNITNLQAVRNVIYGEPPSVSEKDIEHVKAVGYLEVMRERLSMLEYLNGKQTGLSMSCQICRS